MPNFNKADQERQQQAEKVRGWSVQDFHDRLAEKGITRAAVVFENGEFTLTHRELKELQAFFELSQDFSRHEAVFIGREEGIPTLFFAFVHDTRRGLSQGGLRFKPYKNLAEVLVDGLRLAQGMTRKNALAGLDWGGGKGIVPVTADLEALRKPATPELEEKREQLFKAYGRFVASLGGVYYTAEDIGTNTPDMTALLSQNRFTTCIPVDLGGSGNPSPYTAHGVFRAMQAAWLFLNGRESLKGVKVAVQGTGNVGYPLIQKLLQAKAKVWITDIQKDRLEELKAKHPDLEIVESEAIFDLDVDVFAPCAIGAQVNVDTIPRLKCQLVCGAANNILKEAQDAQRLLDRGITFVPDYLCNRMGIVNCADEWHGYLAQDVRQRAESVFPDTLRVLKYAKHMNIPTTQAADELADAAATELHPLIGHRGRRLIDAFLRQVKSQPTDRFADWADSGFDPGLDEVVYQGRWEKQGAFRGQTWRLATAPLSTATGPQLGDFLRALLVDVRARSRTRLLGQSVQRILGAEHGGLALEQNIEQSLPLDRQEYGRPEFVRRCLDQHLERDAAIRDQLRALGVGFDPKAWLDPLSGRGAEVLKRLYLTLEDAGALALATDLEDAPEATSGGQKRPYVVVKLRDAREHVRNALSNGSIEFSSAHWQREFERLLNDEKPWCISRQTWWGPEIPQSAHEDVLSTWFAAVALALAGQGWPEQACPKPIDEVHVDPAWLSRWVLPAQLVAFKIFGRPAFRKVCVHGSLHLVERRLKERRGQAQSHDEQRFVFRTVRRAMRRSLGNVVEPKTLIHRFGADALRLGMLLCMTPGDHEVFSASESVLRQARRSIHNLIKAVGVLKTRHDDEGESLSVSELWIRARLIEHCQAARDRLLAGDFGAVATMFVTVVKDMQRAAQMLLWRQEQGLKTASRPMLAGCLRVLDPVFSALCPFVFGKLVDALEHEAKPMPAKAPVALSLMRVMAEQPTANLELWLGLERVTVEPALPEMVQAVRFKGQLAVAEDALTGEDIVDCGAWRWRKV